MDYHKKKFNAAKKIAHAMAETSKNNIVWGYVDTNTNEYYLTHTKLKKENHPLNMCYIGDMINCDFA